jgi:hypothetical protein
MMTMYVSSYEDIYHVVLLKLSDGGILRRGFICMVVFPPFTPPRLVKIRIRDDGLIGNTRRLYPAHYTTPRQRTTTSQPETEPEPIIPLEPAIENAYPRRNQTLELAPARQIRHDAVRRHIVGVIQTTTSALRPRLHTPVERSARKPLALMLLCRRRRRYLLLLLLLRHE